MMTECWIPSLDFNPRTSHEVRLKEGSYVDGDGVFQSTHLSRGATCEER